MPLSSVLVCHGCGYQASTEDAYPFRCPRARDGDDVDHVLRRRLDPGGIGRPSEVFDDAHPNPFLRYRRLLHSYLTARARGLEDAEFAALVGELDGAIARTNGAGFRVTPFAAERELAAEIGAGEAWVKDETGNVSGTHKGRHLMGVMLWLRAMERLEHRQAAVSDLLAAASCGNAALAAAVVARAAGRGLEVFVPELAHPGVLERLRLLGAELVTCRRDEAETGDPCFRRLQEELRRGVLPFTCQGNENGLIADGGATLAWEMVSSLRAAGGGLDRLFVQVGGGALAASCFQALEESVELGVLARLPRLHAVQTEGAYPLWRAWRRIVGRLLDDVPPGDEPVDPDTATGWAEAVLRLPPGRVREALRHAATHRGEFMWPWEEEPSSAAYSILDDETYDWLAVVEGLLVSGGHPLVAPEELIQEGHRLARGSTGIPVDPTGSAGLAGCLALRRAGVDLTGESVAFLFTGVERSGR